MPDVVPALAGVPRPEMAWYKDAALIILEKLSRFQLLADGSLQISGLLPDDTGMFQCFARNAAGEVQTTTYLAVTSRCQPPSALNPGWAPQGPWETLPWEWDPLWSGSAPGWALGRASGGSLCLSTPQALPPTSPGVPRTAR